MVKGLLFVLLALSLCGSRASASNTLFTQKTVVVISVLDQVAFSDTDVESFNRYVKRILPQHEVIQVSTNASFFTSEETIKDQVRENIKSQIQSKIKARHLITHLIIMDHGSTDLKPTGNATSLRHLGAFNENEVNPEFKEIFDPLVGKFSKNAFVFIESCSTVCDELKSSQKRIQNLMKYFNIPEGRVFAAYQDMVSVGYDFKFHLEQVGVRIKHPAFYLAGAVLGFSSQLPLNDFNVVEALVMSAGATAALSVGVKIYGHIKIFFHKVNWGYLYQFRKGTLFQISSLNPYHNKDELFLNRDIRKSNVIVYSCRLLFQ